MVLETTTNAILLVEGEHDQHVIWSLCKFHQVRQNFEVKRPKEQGGKADNIETVLQLFPEYILGDKYKTIGVVLDADADIAKRWSKLTKLINQTALGYVIPSIPQQNGTVINSPDEYAPRIGIWLMPNNQLPGELEDFVAYLVPSTDPLSPEANRILNEIEAARLDLYKGKRSKAFIYTWLAWQKTPGIPMGKAITYKTLLADAAMAQLFVDWLNNLFNPNF